MAGGESNRKDGIRPRAERPRAPRLGRTPLARLYPLDLRVRRRRHLARKEALRRADLPRRTFLGRFFQMNIAVGLPGKAPGARAYPHFPVVALQVVPGCQYVVHHAVSMHLMKQTFVGFVRPSATERSAAVIPIWASV